jgi:hypothetical protein
LTVTSVPSVTTWVLKVPTKGDDQQASAAIVGGPPRCPSRVKRGQPDRSRRQTPTRGRRRRPAPRGPTPLPSRVLRRSVHIAVHHDVGDPESFGVSLAFLTAGTTLPVCPR